MDLRQLRYFVMIAEELHFGRAAERLNIVQPALSIQIKALEGVLGVQLLSRTNRVVTLTDAGRIFLKEARRTLEQAEHAIAVARRAGRGETGRIDIGYDANGAYSGVLSATIREFRRRAPDVELGLQEIHPETQIRNVLEGRINIGFVTRPVGALPLDLDTVHLMQWPLRIAVPSDHHLARRNLVTRNLLIDESFIGLTESAGRGYSSYVQRVVGFAPRMAYQADGAFALIALVGAGLGVALVPASVSSISVGQNVAYLPIQGVTDKIGIDLVFRRNQENPAVTHFVTVSRESHN